MSIFGKDAPDSLYVLLCRYIRSQATHRYISITGLETIVNCVTLRVAVKLSALGRAIRISERARVLTDLARHNTPVKSTDV